MRPVRFTIGCRPTTKKTSNQVRDIGRRCGACRRGERSIVEPSELYQQFEQAACRALQVAWGTRETARIPCALCGATGKMQSGRYRGKVCLRCGGTKIQALPICDDVVAEIVVYRERAIGDVAGFAQAIGDVLEMAGVVDNDRQIIGWPMPADGGAPLRKDADRPRVIVELRAWAQTEMALESA